MTTFEEHVAAALGDLRAGVPRPEIWRRHGIIATREAELRLAAEEIEKTHGAENV